MPKNEKHVLLCKTMGLESFRVVYFLRIERNVPLSIEDDTKVHVKEPPLRPHRTQSTAKCFSFRLV